MPINGQAARVGYSIVVAEGSKWRSGPIEGKQCPTSVAIRTRCARHDKSCTTVIADLHCRNRLTLSNHGRSTPTSYAVFALSG
ncbi:MAG: hypothetical protein WAM52_01245 [Steroidobacteraceae bacterium]